MTIEKVSFNPLRHPVCLSFPLWRPETAWMEHVPFAMFLVSALRPRILVELGAFRGASYCAFCQTVKELRLETKCYAVDTWQGDEHAGSLGAEALQNLREHHDGLYGSFSRLVQSTFDDALEHFAAGSIDLLHIDGFHSYEAVRRDFETWLPKMSERGVILFHDINVRERGFGVWRLWDEIKQERNAFEFLHGHGLGVLAVGNETAEDLKKIFAAGEAERTLIREFFRQLGWRLELAVKAEKWENVILQRENKISEQQRYIEALQTYEKTVRNSAVMRGYRIISQEGISSFIKKGIKKK